MPSVTPSDPLGDLLLAVLITAAPTICLLATQYCAQLSQVASRFSATWPFTPIWSFELVCDSYGRPCVLRRYACSSQTLSEHAGGLHNKDKRSRRPAGSIERYGTGISPVNNTDRGPKLFCLLKITSSHTSLLRPDRPSKRASAGGTAAGLGAIPQD